MVSVAHGTPSGFSVGTRHFPGASRHSLSRAPGTGGSRTAKKDLLVVLPMIRVNPGIGASGRPGTIQGVPAAQAHLAADQTLASPSANLAEIKSPRRCLDRPSAERGSGPTSVRPPTYPCRQARNRSKLPLAPLAGAGSARNASSCGQTLIARSISGSDPFAYSPACIIISARS